MVVHPAAADFVGWTANVRNVSGGYLVNVFAVTDNPGDVLLNRYGGVAGPSDGFITTNAAGGFRQGDGAQSTFAPAGHQGWTTLDSFLTVGATPVGTDAWAANPATVGDPTWFVSYFDSVLASTVTVNAFSTPSNASGFANPFLAAIPPSAGWYIGGTSAPARSLAGLSNRVASTGAAAAAATHGMLVAQLYITDTAFNRTVSWRLGASMRRPDGSLSQGMFEFVIPVNPCVTDLDGDGVLDCSDNCPTVPNPGQADCDSNGIGDACEGLADCDADGVPDSCEIAGNPSLDCNGNGVLDSCDVASGSPDFDGNGKPDECQTVTVPGQSATIQAAIAAAPAGEMRIVSVAAGIYAGPIDFLGKPVIVRGASSASTVIQGTGGAVSSVVRFSGGEPAIAALERVTVRGGTTGSPLPGAPQFLVGGGIMSYQSAANVRDCVIEQNFATFGGGGYWFSSTGRIERCTIRSNGSGADGGGLQLFAGAITVADTTVENNVCNSRGAGLHAVDGRPVLLRSIVRNNQSGNVAGGVSWVPFGSPTSLMTVEDSQVTANTASVVQGGIGIQPDGPTVKISLAGTTVCSNIPRPNIAGAWTDLGGNTVCVCIGDLNDDDAVNGNDLGVLLAAWGQCTSPACPPDFNDDGVVDGNDLGVLLARWGFCPP
jgi:hypothetical protein